MINCDSYSSVYFLIIEFQAPHHRHLPDGGNNNIFLNGLVIQSACYIHCSCDLSLIVQLIADRLYVILVLSLKLLMIIKTSSLLFTEFPHFKLKSDFRVQNAQLLLSFKEDKIYYQHFSHEKHQHQTFLPPQFCENWPAS